MARACQPPEERLAVELRGWPRDGVGEIVTRLRVESFGGPPGHDAHTLEVTCRGEVDGGVATVRIVAGLRREELRAWCRAVLAATEAR